MSPETIVRSVAGRLGLSQAERLHIAIESVPLLRIPKDRPSDVGRKKRPGQVSLSGRAGE